MLFLYRPEYYKITEDDQGNSTLGQAELSIAKHRNGALKDINLRFISKYAKFTDLAAPEAEIAMASRPELNFQPSGNSYTMPSKMNTPK